MLRFKSFFKNYLNGDFRDYSISFPFWICIQLRLSVRSQTEFSICKFGCEIIGSRSLRHLLLNIILLCLLYCVHCRSHHHSGMDAFIHTRNGLSYCSCHIELLELSIEISFKSHRFLRFSRFNEYKRIQVIRVL